MIAGGGAAGFFAAIACARARPTNDVRIYERSPDFLTKVRISGGGRCNVTHTPLPMRDFAARYPRGERTLPGLLHRFPPEATSQWFGDRGVRLKTEADGRVFPTTDDSQTIVDCLMNEARSAGVRLFTRNGVEAVQRSGEEFELHLTRGETTCHRLLLATGGARSPSGARIAAALGHTIEPPVPSLFALHCPEPWLHALAGISVGDVELTLAGTNLRQRGPLLLTHQGLSGPVVLRLSAWGAREFGARAYRGELSVNWLPSLTPAALQQEFQDRRVSAPRKKIARSPLGSLPARLWVALTERCAIPDGTTWSNLTRAQAAALLERITRSKLAVDGKSLNKDEFVTCGGVALREVDLRTMESRFVPRLYFAGELLDIDGITGGFNFQSAWATGWIAGHAMAGVEVPR